MATERPPGRRSKSASSVCGPKPHWLINKTQSAGLENSQFTPHSGEPISLREGQSDSSFPRTNAYYIFGIAKTWHLQSIERCRKIWVARGNRLQHCGDHPINDRRCFLSLKPGSALRTRLGQGRISHRVESGYERRHLDRQFTMPKKGKQ